MKRRTNSLQVVRVPAGFVPAAVMNVMLQIDRANKNLIGNPMNRIGTLFHKDMPIALRGDAASPFPTAVGQTPGMTLKLTECGAENLFSVIDLDAVYHRLQLKDRRSINQQRSCSLAGLPVTTANQIAPQHSPANSLSAPTENQPGISYRNPFLHYTSVFVATVSGSFVPGRVRKSRQ